MAEGSAVALHSSKLLPMQVLLSEPCSVPVRQGSCDGLQGRDVGCVGGNGTERGSVPLWSTWPACMDPSLEEEKANGSSREVLGRGWMLMGNNPAKPEGSSGKLWDRRAERWQ